MSKLLGAMKLKIREIVLVEERPFCFIDLLKFEIGGEKYETDHGTIRNYVQVLRKQGFVKSAFTSRPAFYTIPGKEFDKMMTLSHMGVPNAIIDQSTLKRMPIYKWLKNQPMTKQSLHNIRVRFDAPRLWHIFSKRDATLANPANKDVVLSSSLYFDYLDVKVTIHHTDTVSVTISCSFQPIAVDIPDILPLCEALTRTEIKLAIIIENDCNKVTIPRYTGWIVTMWHFGVDTIAEFTGKEFEVTFGEGISDLYRIYTKRMMDGKNRVRSERQEYPNQKYADALIRKLFPDGHLISS